MKIIKLTREQKFCWIHNYIVCLLKNNFSIHSFVWIFDFHTFRMQRTFIYTFMVFETFFEKTLQCKKILINIMRTFHYVQSFWPHGETDEAQRAAALMYRAVRIQKFPKFVGHAFFQCCWQFKLLTVKTGQKCLLCCKKSCLRDQKQIGQKGHRTICNLWCND